ncbi:MAG: SPASM domain-containing protein [Anaerolineales bacterium]
MEGKDRYLISVDENGKLSLPTELAAKWGIKPGASIRIDAYENGLFLRRPTTQISKIYIEPTNQCNLECRTCIRNIWDEAPGFMSDTTFGHIIQEEVGLETSPTIFFGGFGEPLYHPNIADMVAQASAAGANVELITNGTLLSLDISRKLIKAGLKRLWVSLDGATPESYADVRLGAQLPQVLKNLAAFRDARPPGHQAEPRIGIVFVAMRRNLSELPDLIHLGTRLGATKFLVSNVLPHTEEMRAELLYSQSLSEITYLPSIWVPHLDLAKLDLNPESGKVLLETLQTGINLSYSGQNLGSTNDKCPFIEAGTVVFGWDGSVYPCLPLSHDFSSYLNNRRRHSRRYVLGNINQDELDTIWDQPDYRQFRRRVQDFHFSPCTFCGGCDLVEANEEDCYGNTFPTCGGCLWAQGVLRCP